jgi:hypothetical protein
VISLRYFFLGLNDKQLDSILDGICIAVDKRKIIKKPKLSANNDGSNAGIANEEDNYVMRQPLSYDQDETCPICQDEMTNEQALTWCRKGCGNNIHAKCMMKFSQYKLSNKQEPSCPLCRELWDVTVLKADCRGKASLKASYTPVHCMNCHCLQRGVFYRCIECSQVNCKQLAIGNTNSVSSSSSSGGISNISGSSKKPFDLCFECYTHPSPGNNIHQLHHFISSDVRIEITQGLEWIPCKNPTFSSSGLHDNHRDNNISSTTTNNHHHILNHLQNRELNVNDYELLLQLDDNGPSLQLYDVCINALPIFDRLNQKSHTSNNNSSSSTYIAKVKNTLCWCNSMTSTAVNHDLQHYSTNHNRQLRLLPCHHVAHDICMRSDIKLLIADDNTSLISDYRCCHINCGRKIFYSLTRQRKSMKTIDNNKVTSTTTTSSTAMNDGGSSRGRLRGNVNTEGDGSNNYGDGGMMTVGIIGQGCFINNSRSNNNDINMSDSNISSNTANGNNYVSTNQIRKKSLRYKNTNHTNHDDDNNRDQGILPALTISNSNQLNNSKPILHPHLLSSSSSHHHRDYHHHQNQQKTTINQTLSSSSPTNNAGNGRFGAYGGSIIPDWVNTERVDPLIFPQPPVTTTTTTTTTTTNQINSNQSLHLHSTIEGTITTTTMNTSFNMNNNTTTTSLLLSDSIKHQSTMRGDAGGNGPVVNHLNHNYKQPRILGGIRMIRNSNSMQQSRLKPLLSRSEIMKDNDITSRIGYGSSSNRYNDNDDDDGYKNNNTNISNIDYHNDIDNNNIRVVDELLVRSNSEGGSIKHRRLTNDSNNSSNIINSNRRRRSKLNRNNNNNNNNNISMITESINITHFGKMKMSDDDDDHVNNNVEQQTVGSKLPMIQTNNYSYNNNHNSSRRNSKNNRVGIAAAVADRDEKHRNVIDSHAFNTNDDNNSSLMIDGIASSSHHVNQHHQQQQQQYHRQIIHNPSNHNNNTTTSTTTTTDNYKITPSSHRGQIKRGSTKQLSLNSTIHRIDGDIGMSVNGHH